MFELYCVSKQPPSCLQVDSPRSRWCVRQTSPRFEHAKAVRADAIAIDFDSPDCLTALRTLQELRPEALRVVIADAWRPAMRELLPWTHQFVSRSDDHWPQRIADSAFHASLLISEGWLRRRLSSLRTLPSRREERRLEGGWDPISLAMWLRCEGVFAAAPLTDWERDLAEWDSTAADPAESEPTAANPTAAGMSNEPMGDTVSDFDSRRLYVESQAVSEACGEIAERCHLPASRCTAFRLAGALHNLGQFALAASVEDYPELRATAEQIEKPLEMVERHVLGADYTHVGGFLASLWGFPSELREAIEHHLQPRRVAAGAEVSPVTAVYAARNTLLGGDLDHGLLLETGLDRVQSQLQAAAASSPATVL